MGDFTWFDTNPACKTSRYKGYIFGKQLDISTSFYNYKRMCSVIGFKGLLISFICPNLHKGLLFSKKVKAYYPIAGIKYTSTADEHGRRYNYKHIEGEFPVPIDESKIDPLVLNYVQSGQWLICTDEILARRSCPTRYVDLNTGKISTMITRKKK